MGLCGSSMTPADAAEKGADKKVEQLLKEQQQADAKINKLLLLGQSQTRRRRGAGISIEMAATR